MVFPSLTVRENLRLGAINPRARPQWQRSLDRVFHLFPRLLERESQLAVTLSGGEQQMLAIGRGLMAQPRLMLLDEPTLGLSPLMAGVLAAGLVLVPGAAPGLLHEAGDQLILITLELLGQPRPGAARPRPRHPRHGRHPRRHPQRRDRPRAIGGSPRAPRGRATPGCRRGPMRPRALLGGGRGRIPSDLLVRWGLPVPSTPPACRDGPPRVWVVHSGLGSGTRRPSLAPEGAAWLATASRARRGGRRWW